MARKATKRTDPHRPGAIMPAEYSYVLSYNCATSEGGWPIPSFGINCALDRRVTTKDPVTGAETVVNGEHDDDGECCQCGLLAAGKTVHTGPGKCSICGAAFVYGDIWKHEPTGEYIHVGHDCAEKYRLLADRSEWEMTDRRARAAAVAMASRSSNEGRLRRFCESRPGLLEALETPHEIVADMKRKLREYGSLSEKQIAFVFKLATEAKNPPPPELHVPAPTGKQTFRGRVVSVKCYDGYAYGSVNVRFTVKVETPAGSWLAWGTAPSACLSESVNHGGLKGCDVEITATLKPGRDAHFAIMSRPRGKVTRLACCDRSGYCSACDSESLAWCPAPPPPVDHFADFEKAGAA